MVRAYHGTHGNTAIAQFSVAFSDMDLEERGIYFTDSVAHANQYATGWGDAGPEYGGAIYPVLLRIRRLYEISAEQWAYGQGLSPQAARSAGFDGYVITGQESGNTFIVFDGAQVLPAVGLRYVTIEGEWISPQGDDLDAEQAIPVPSF